MSVNTKLFDGHNTLWVIHIGNDDRIALRARNEGFVCIGWTQIGNLARYKTREAMKAAITEAWPGWKPAKIRASYGQPYRFAHEMRLGDPVVFPIRVTSEIGPGRIVGDYQFSTDRDLVESDYCNVRKVDWLKILPRTVFTQPALHSFGSLSSVSTSDDFLDEFLGIALGTDLPGGKNGTLAEMGADGVAASDDDDESFDLYETAVQETEDYLLKEWHRSGTAFEHVVAAVMEAIGYTATVTSPSNDHSVDVIAHPDPLGLAAPFIKMQVKSGTEKAGEPELNELMGALQPGEKGIYVSLGGFTPSAKAKARNSSNITLIDAKKFVALFLDHYDRLSPAYRAKYPLSKVYVPQRKLS